MPSHAQRGQTVFDRRRNIALDMTADQPSTLACSKMRSGWKSSSAPVSVRFRVSR